MELINFAIDFGNGYVKAKSEKGEFVIPAKLGFERDLGTSSLGGMLEQSYDINIFHRKQDKVNYVFGKEIDEAISPEKHIKAYSSNNRYTLTSFQQLVDFSLAELASFENEKTIDVRLVTGMPSRDMDKQGLVNDFKEFLEGHHIVFRNGEEFVINVKELRIIEQPLGTLLNVFLTDDLKVHRTFKEGLIVVIDFGSGTTIVDVYQNMKRVGGDTIRNGMIQFYNGIAKLLSEDKSIDVDSQYIEEGIMNKTYIAKFGQQKISFKDQFEQVLIQRLQTVIQKYENEIEREELVNDFIITGGGSYIIGEQLKEHKPTFRIADNPQLSTAKGYFKLAQSLRKAEVNE